MAATATARTRAAARRAPARQPASKPAPRRRRAAPRRQTPAGGFVPVAVGAVGGLADSGLVVRMTRSRLWIGVLGVLLIGIVALNVVALNFSASSSEAARQADELERLNSALRGDIATRLSGDQVEAAAGELGLAIPEPGAIRYLRRAPADAAEAARRLRDGELGAQGYVAPAASAPVDPALASAAEAVVGAPAQAAPVTETAEPEVPATEAVAPETVAPTATAAPTAPAGGGGVAAP